MTVRLADSLPAEALARLQEIHASLTETKAASEQFAVLQRQYFRTMEKFLHAGAGRCLLREDAAASIVAMELSALREWRIAVPHFTIMPNHWHALFVPETGCGHSLHEAMKRVKGRSGLQLRKKIGGDGAVWQREWFDRWMRDDVEWDRTVDYIRGNPVEAGLAPSWQEHRWTK